MEPAYALVAKRTGRRAIKRYAPDWAKLLDVNMLAQLTGRERTLEQFRARFRTAGLRLSRAHAMRRLAPRLGQICYQMPGISRLVRPQ